MNTVTSSDGTTIAFDRRGTGQPLILVGGAFQHRAIDPRTAELAELLAADFTVYHYDRRGRGDSTDTAPYAVGREIEDLEALAEEAGGSAFLFGMSSGAALVLDAAAHGLAAPKLAVYEPPFVVDDSRPPTPRHYSQQLAELAAEGRRGDTVEFFLTAGVGVPAEAVAGMRQAAVWPQFEEVAHTLPYDAVLLDGTTAGAPLPARRWSSVTSAVLVADGGASPPSMRVAADALAALLADARRRTLPGQEHDVAPDVLAPVLADFFAG
jgi:pimeloyl-ACP methyl ester carboxylesterase